MEPTPPTLSLSRLVAQEIDSPSFSAQTRGEVQGLLAKGASLNFPLMREGKPCYPLAVAILGRNPEWVRYLLDLGASTMLDSPSLESTPAGVDGGSFQPLGLSLDILCMETELCREVWLNDVDNADIQILEMLLERRPDVLERDPLKENLFEPSCEMPLLRWADHLVALKEEMDGSLSQGQVAIAAKVLNALLSHAPDWFQDQVKSAIKDEVPESKMDPDAEIFCKKIKRCPEAARLWWSGVEAQRMDEALPRAEPSNPSVRSIRL